MTIFANIMIDSVIRVHPAEMSDDISDIIDSTQRNYRCYRFWIG